MEQNELNEFMKKSGVDKLPEVWQNVIKRIYSSYPLKCLPNGICDSVYICNIIAHELKLGDGRTNFYKYSVIKN